jgi:hypothetical protein
MFEHPGSLEHVRTGLVAPDVANCPAGLVGVLPPCPLTLSGTFIPPDALFAALTLLWVFFPVLGGLLDAIVAPAATPVFFGSHGRAHFDPRLWWRQTHQSFPSGHP